MERQKGSVGGQKNTVRGVGVTAEAKPNRKKWTKEKWGRINKDKEGKVFNNSRYLPKRVRESLSAGKKRAASRGKRLGSRKKYTGAVKRKMSNRGGVCKAKTRIRKGRK